MTDKEIAEALGMSHQNLTRTYKNSKDEKKRLMYEMLSIGFKVREMGIDLKEFENYNNFKSILLGLEYQKNKASLH